MHLQKNKCFVEKKSIFVVSKNRNSLFMDILFGMQWGDEGKGKVVDLLSTSYNIICRYQGGPNAGHTLVWDNKKVVLHTLPSGVVQDNTMNIIGNGVVVNPKILIDEIKEVNQLIHRDITPNVMISSNAHLILPTHELIDSYSEQNSTNPIGSTKKGIGPTYTDKVSRHGFKIKFLLEKDYKDRLKQHIEQHLKQYPNIQLDNKKWEEWLQAAAICRTLNIQDTAYYLASQKDKNILAEGAQGFLLDNDFGTYPFVTSSNTMAAGACVGLGISPKKVNHIIGIMKAYTTRVGNGDFPTEQNNECGEKIRQIGHEFGATTGRQRRCGWLDIPLLKYACMVNGIDQIAMMKLDVLSTFSEIPVSIKYKETDQQVDMEHLDKVTPVYQIFKGWQKDITTAKTLADLPTPARVYIDFIEKQIDTEIKIISVGPDRNQTILK